MTDLLSRSATDLTAAIRAGRVKPSDLMAATLDRIDAVNPEINAIVALRGREELMAEARAADTTEPHGPLHGLPLAIKDMQPTQGIRTTFGSPLYADNVPDEDALLPARLRAAGGILIGKTNVPEFALGSHTFNAVYGATRNPFDANRTAGGSSGGAAAALATRMLTVADGSDMMGSLRNPAAWNGVWSIRPTFGLVPEGAPADPLLHRLSTDGPMARHPEDLGMILDILAAPAPGWPLPIARTPGGEPTLEGARIGWLGDWSGAIPFEAGILGGVEDALRQMEAAGATVEAVPAPFPSDRMWDAWVTLRAWRTLNVQRAEFDDPDKRPQMKATLLWECERGLLVTPDDIHAASLTRAALIHALGALFTRFDALILPTTQVWPFPVEVEYPTEIAGVTMPTYHRWMEVMLPASLTGLPAAGLPAGFGPTGLPLGMQLIGPPGSDNRLLALAQGWAEAAGERIRLPEILPVR